MSDRKTQKSNKPPAGIPDTAGKHLVIVESPAKARTINKYLGPDYVVMASVGHVRDLLDKNPKGVHTPVPGVDLDKNFKPHYEIIRGKGSTVKKLKQASRRADDVWLATDLDREGEAIAWHLSEALGVNPEKRKRVVFNAITKGDIEKAFRNPRQIDMNTVKAQQARRILDRIVGYQVSPLLWKKVAGGLSAGRVQSVAVRLIVEREREIEAFVPEEYWKVIGYFTTDLDSVAALYDAWIALHRDWPNNQHKNGKANGPTIQEKNMWLHQHQAFSAELVEVKGKKFRPENVEKALALLKPIGFCLDKKIESENPKAKGKAQYQVRVVGHLEKRPTWHVRSMETKRTKSHPLPPFITSTLQQAAATQLDFTAQTTMRIAQSLYEGVSIASMGSVGLITYMRTDSTHLSREAIKNARTYIKSQFGSSYLPEKPNFYASSKAAQEAHEAIRPTDVSLTPDRVRPSLKNEQFRLYRIIWERFVACQMTEAQWDATTLFITPANGPDDFVFRATGRTLVFDGYYRVAGIPNHSTESVFPPLSQKQPLAALHLEPAQTFTLPPPRYNEASLVKKLEAEGIGRPSTYAQIIQVIQNRNYVEKIRNRFYATDLGKVVTDKLVEAFPDILQVGYTRDMEQELDNVEEKQVDWVKMLHRFYGPFKNSLDAAYDKMAHAKTDTEPAPFSCPDCGGGTVYRFGRNGRFLSCANYPDCKYASPIDREGNPVSPEETDVACPHCGTPMLLRNGRFGPFLSCPQYPDCKGIVNLDKKGFISPPTPPPLLTDLTCAKCGAPLNLRRGKRGPWLSCSAFPKCRGRRSWTSLPDEVKNKWENALEAHEREHPQPIIKSVDGKPIGEDHRPNTKDINGDCWVQKGQNAP
jgi:DNA topoisomerase-1